MRGIADDSRDGAGGYCVTDDCFDLRSVVLICRMSGTWRASDIRQSGQIYYEIGLHVCVKSFTFLNVFPHLQSVKIDFVESKAVKTVPNVQTGERQVANCAVVNAPANYMFKKQACASFSTWQNGTRVCTNFDGLCDKRTQYIMCKEIL